MLPKKTALPIALILAAGALILVAIAAENRPENGAESESAQLSDQKKGADMTNTRSRRSKKIDYRNLTDEQWRNMLTPEQYRILREKGTERAFTGKYWNTKDDGVYLCAGCGLELFDSDTKYESGSGWPSFFSPADTDRVATETDTTFGMVRTEILCSRCGSHLGHVFPDGPNPTGMRYCVNSVSLKLKPDTKNQEVEQTSASENTTKKKAANE